MIEKGTNKLTMKYCERMKTFFTGLCSLHANLALKICL